MKRIRKAVIPAAGYGTRFLPATKAQPKEMLPIVDKPAIQYIVEEAMASGIEEILVITGRNKRAIEDHFDGHLELEQLLIEKGKTDLLQAVRMETLPPIHYVRQREALGLGHAIYCARSFIGDEPFAVLLGDDLVYHPEKPCLQQLIACYHSFGGTILGAQEVATEEVSSYGIVDGPQLTSRVIKVEQFVEKPRVEEAPSRIAVLGRYILNPDIFDALAETPPGAGGEIQLTDAISRLESPVFAFQYEGRRYDIGSKQGYLEATMEYALRDPRLGSSFAAYVARTWGPQRVHREEKVTHAN